MKHSGLAFSRGLKSRDTEDSSLPFVRLLRALSCRRHACKKIGITIYYAAHTEGFVKTATGRRTWTCSLLFDGGGDGRGWDGLNVGWTVGRRQFLQPRRTGEPFFSFSFFPLRCYLRRIHMRVKKRSSQRGLHFTEIY